MRKHLIFAPCDEGRPTQIVRFDDVPEFVQAACGDKSPEVAADWAGASKAAVIHGALNGDERYVAPALELLDAVDAEIPPTHGPAVKRSPFGGRVSHGDWMAGSPTPMRRRQRDTSDRGAVQVFVSFGPSASLDYDTLVARGAAIMALIMKIQQYRPVTLELYDETQMQTSGIPCYFRIGVNCQPLSLAHVGFAISHVGFFRQLGLSAEYACGAEASAWPADMICHRDATSPVPYYEQRKAWDAGYRERRDQRMEINPCDVMLSSATDWNPLIHKPIEWIKAELARIGLEA